ncbi:tetratricopeptide repeat protein, partial [candidate division WOR-3 bacterium]|nr:tetratricopeptide repeat protein [candidate division WOR-3 bacterium]
MNKIAKEFIDDLTGLYNRRYLYIKAPRKIEKTQEMGIPLSIVLIDLDHFKNVNDTYGHRRGDVVLKEFGLFIKTLLRADDTVFRYGGDEFVCILPNANYEQAKRISRRFVEQCRINEFAQLRLTMSIGIASCPLNAKDWLGLFEIADRNLYSAKRHGRDRVGIFEKEKKGLIIPTKEIIGRDEEIVKFKELIDPIFSGSGGAVCISGEVGVGKTRLVHEIIRDSDFQDIQFLNSNLSATTKSIPYYPFREIIRTVIKKQGEESLFKIPRAYQIELVKIVPELSDKSKEVDKDIYMVDKFRLFEGVRRFLALQASKVPLFVCLDNIHWADHSSLELFHYLVRVLKDSSVFFFFVYRVEETKHSSFQNVLQLMAREGLYEKIDLEPLQTADVARMLSLMIDGIPPSELTEYIFKESGGNPFFIEELMKSVEINGALIWDKDKCVFDKGKKVVIPYSVEGVIDRKLGMMNKDARDLLEYAAVVGREFDFSFLRDITKMNEGHLFDMMDEILGMRLLKESEGEQYRFSEDIIREIIYQRINKIKLRRYHQVVGERLLNSYKDRIEEVVEELSDHFYVSGDQKRIIEYSMIAADRAKSSYANQDAIRFYSRVFKYLKDEIIEDRESKEIECLNKRVKVLELIGENERVIEDLEEVVKKAKKIGNKKEEANCLVAFCEVYRNKAQYNKAVQKAEKALEIYRELNDKKGEASSFTHIGSSYWCRSKYPKALEFFQKSLKIQEKIGDRTGEATNFNSIGIVYGETGEYSKALDFFQKSLEIKKEIGDRRGTAASLNNIGIVHDHRGDYSEALDFFQGSLKIIKKIGDRRGEALILNNIGISTRCLGKSSKALEFHKQSLKISEEIGDRRVEAACLINIGIINDNLGEFSKALESYQWSLKIQKEIGDREGETASLLSIGKIFTEKNDFSNAEKYYNKALLIAQEIKSKLLLVDVGLDITSLYLAKGNLTDAKKSLKQALSIADELGSKVIKAGVLCLTGRLYTKEKKWDRAKSSFEESISILKETKDTFRLAEVYYYQGLMFKESGDKPETKKYFTKAMRIFKKIGAKAWIEKVTRELGTRKQGDKGTRRQGEKGSFEVKKLGRWEKGREMSND